MNYEIRELLSLVLGSGEYGGKFKPLYLKFKSKLEKDLAEKCDESSLKCKRLRAEANDILGILAVVDLVSNEITAKYYKASQTGSIKIVVDNNIKKLIATATECKLKNRLTSELVKNEYVVKNNLNFISYDSSLTKQKISYLSKDEFYNLVSHTVLRTILYLIKDSHLFKYIEYKQFRFMLTNQDIKNKLADISDRKYTEEAMIISRFMNLRLNLNHLAVCIKKQYKNLPIIRPIHIDTNIGKFVSSKRWINTTEIKPLVDRAEVFMSEMMNINYHKLVRIENNFLDSTIDAIKKGEIDNLKTMPRVSNIGSNMFNSFEFSRDICMKYTIPTLVESVNPLTGFVSIKTDRKYILDSDMQKEEVMSFTKDFTATCSFYEDVKNTLDQNLMLAQQVQSKAIKIISGSDIIAAYNHTSYFKDKKKRNSEWLDGNGGPIYSSCMRYSTSKEKIGFYANNSKFVKLLTYSNDGTNIINGRVLLWYNEDKDIYYVDRIYYDSSNTLLAIRNFVETNSNFFYIHSQSAGKSSKLTDDFAIKITELHKSHDIPYFDSINKALRIGASGALYIGSDSGIMSIYNESSVLDTNKLLGVAEIDEATLKNVKPENANKETVNKKCFICGRDFDVIFVNSENMKNKGYRHGVYTCSDHIIKVDDDIYTLESNVIRLSGHSKENYVINPFSYAKFRSIEKESEINKIKYQDSNMANPILNIMEIVKSSLYKTTSLVGRERSLDRGVIFNSPAGLNVSYPYYITRGGYNTYGDGRYFTYFDKSINMAKLRDSNAYIPVPTTVSEKTKELILDVLKLYAVHEYIKNTTEKIDIDIVNISSNTCLDLSKHELEPSNSYILPFLDNDNHVAMKYFKILDKNTCYTSGFSLEFKAKVLFNYFAEKKELIDIYKNFIKDIGWD